MRDTTIINPRPNLHRSRPGTYRLLDTTTGNWWAWHFGWRYLETTDVQPPARPARPVPPVPAGGLDTMPIETMNFKKLIQVAPSTYLVRFPNQMESGS